MENHNTHLALGFTFNDLIPGPANVAVFWGLLGPGDFNSLHQMSFQQWNHFFPCGQRTSQTPLCSWGFAVPTRHRQVSSCGVAAFALPLFTVLMEFKPSPFSFLLSPLCLFSLVPVPVSSFLLSLQLLLRRGAFPAFFPPPQSPSSLYPQKQFPNSHGFSLPKFTSLCRTC